jgi:site-specific recombinase XerC
MEKLMDKLTWELSQLQRNNRDGSRSTQENRKKILNMTAQHLKLLGFNRMNTKAIKAKHAIKLIEKWTKEGLSSGTLKNRMSHIRWWAGKVNAIHKIPANEQLGIDRRSYITNESKAVELKVYHLEKVDDENLRYSLRLQAEFGLRREEALKFIVHYADKGDKVVLKDTWCKGKRSREIPIINSKQRELLNEIRESRGNKSLIPSRLNYKQQQDKYRNTIPNIGLGKGHGLRHNYAQVRYKELSGNNCPALGGKRQRAMTEQERMKDREIRLIISEELGHAREQITSVYLGS